MKHIQAALNTEEDEERKGERDPGGDGGEEIIIEGRIFEGVRSTFWGLGRKRKSGGCGER